MERMVNRMQNQVRQEMEHMTKMEQQVAVCFLQDSHDFAFLTLDKIALHAGVSTTSILRFCRRIGFDGYKDFQDALRAEIKSGMTLPLKLQRNSGTEESALLDRVVREGVEAIEQTFASISSDALGDAVRQLSQGHRVFTFGLRESYALAHYAYTRLTTVRNEVHILDAGRDGMMEALLDLQTGDVCLCFLFHRYTELSLRILPLLKASGAAVILVTEEPYEQLLPYADILLPCRVSNTGIKNTALAPICLSDYFCNAVALGGGTSVQTRLDQTEGILRRTAAISD